MASTVHGAKLTDFITYLPSVAEARVESYKRIYDENHHRVYALAFWMTDNEIAAEELMANTFIRIFATSPDADSEDVDRALLAEVRELMPVGLLTVRCNDAKAVHNVRRNTKRVHLERAVVQVPATERLIFLLHDVEGYSNERIARTIGIGGDDCIEGLHQARLRIRELLAGMKD